MLFRENNESNWILVQSRNLFSETSEKEAIVLLQHPSTYSLPNGTGFTVNIFEVPPHARKTCGKCKGTLLFLCVDHVSWI
jgi:hypothetical protein